MAWNDESFGFPNHCRDVAGNARGSIASLEGEDQPLSVRADLSAFVERCRHRRRSRRTACRSWRRYIADDMPPRKTSQYRWGATDARRSPGQRLGRRRGAKQRAVSASVEPVACCARTPITARRSLRPAGQPICLTFTYDRMPCSSGTRRRKGSGERAVGSPPDCPRFP